MPGGAPTGNTNATKNKPWRDAINRALKKRSRVDAKEALDELAEKLLLAAENGEGWALKEVGDRIEGKPAQAVTVSGDEDNPINTQWTVEIVHKNLPSDSD